MLLQEPTQPDSKDFFKKLFQCFYCHGYSQNVGVPLHYSIADRVAKRFKRYLSTQFTDVVADSVNYFPVNLFGKVAG